jgi:hypothetical protein
MAKYLRAIRQGSAAAGPLTFVASTPGVKRDGKDLDPQRWLLDNYRQNPVVLWSHSYGGQHLPIGRADVAVRGEKLTAKIIFDSEDPFAREIERKYRQGFLNAVSVGWDDVKRNGTVYYDLLDISAVPVPGDPDALMMRERAGLRNLHQTLGKKLYGKRGVDRSGGDLQTVLGILESNPDVRKRVVKAVLKAFMGIRR